MIDEKSILLVIVSFFVKHTKGWGGLGAHHRVPKTCHPLRLTGHCGCGPLIAAAYQPSGAGGTATDTRICWPRDSVISRLKQKVRTMNLSVRYVTADLRCGLKLMGLARRDLATN